MMNSGHIGESSVCLINFMCKAILTRHIKAQAWQVTTSSSNTSKVPVLDAEGYAICLDCDSHVNCGTIGLANLEKRHHGKKVCKTAQGK